MPRGRPREFDEHQALAGAMALFWRKGLTATSLDELAKAMQMNRPSIYNAFGNKEAVYRRALAAFSRQLHSAIETILDSEADLATSLTTFFDQAIELYCGQTPPMGCLMICTAPSEALSHPDVGQDLRDLIALLDAAFIRRLQRAQADGELSADVDAEATGQILQATLHTIALRARAAFPADELRTLSRRSIAILGLGP